MTIVFLFWILFDFSVKQSEKKLLTVVTSKIWNMWKSAKNQKNAYRHIPYHIQVILAGYLFIKAEPHFWDLCIRVFSLFLCKSNLQLIWSTLCKWHRYNHFLSLTVNTIKAGFILGFVKTGLIIMFKNVIKF